jgi:SAM-dependent methyltransferase
MSDKDTQDVYDAKAQEYADLTGHDTNSPDLSAFLHELPTGALILDLGCGPGHIARRMAQLGFSVEATDASREMVKIANQLEGVKAHQETFDDLNAGEVYDGIYANFSLLHAKRYAVPEHIAQITRALKPGGLFHIGMKTGTGEKRDGIGRRYCYFSEAELEDMLLANGLTIIHRNHGSDLGLDGVMADWVVLQAKKPS